VHKITTTWRLDLRVWDYLREEREGASYVGT
jgi:hypothetical protein